MQTVWQHFSAYLSQGVGAKKPFGLARLLASFRCRLCWRVALAVFLGIVVVEAVILIPSVRNYERDLLVRLENVGLATIKSGFLSKARVELRDLLSIGRALTRHSEVRGGALYGPDGTLLGIFGEEPGLTPADIADAAESSARRVGDDRYEVFWPIDATGLPYGVIGRLDAGWIRGEVNGFIWRIVGLVLLISTVVTGATLITVGRLVMTPILGLHRNLLAAGADAAHPERYEIRDARSDELGEMFAAFNGMLKHIARNIEDLRGREDALSDANDRLEYRVAERTAEVAKNEALIRTIVDHVFDGIITIDERGVIETFNPAAERMFGYAAAELCGENISILMPEPHRGAHDDYITNYLETGEARIIGAGREVVGRRKDGSTFPLELAITKMRLGQRRMFCGVLRDISERKRTETALRESEQQMRLITEAVPVFIAYVDSDGCYRYVNRACEIWYARPRSEIVGKHIEDLLGETEYRKLRGGVAKALSGKSVTYERSIRYPDGVVRCVQGAYVPDSDPEEGVRGIFVLVHDISDRKRAEAALRESEAALAKAQRVAKIGNWRWSIPENRLISCSEEFARIHGVGLDEIGDHLKHEMERVIHPNDRDRVELEYQRFDEEGIDFEIEYRIVLPDGEVRCVLEIGEAVYDESGRAVEHIGTVQDITERKRAEDALRESEEQLRNIAANVPGAIFRRVLKPDGSIHYPFFDGRYSALFGYDPRTLTGDGSILNKHLHPDDQRRLLKAIRESADSLKTLDIELQITTIEGQAKWIRSVSRPRRGENGEVIADGVILDITEQKEAEQRIEHLAYFDQLTGLPNRTLFNDRLRQAIATARRRDEMLAVMFLDLDQFKGVNDTLGHAAGDEVLKAVAARIAEAVRTSDSVARLSGDEFAIIQTNVTDADGPAILAEKILSSVSEPLRVASRTLRCTATIGIALFPSDGETDSTLLQKADIALFEGKATGRQSHRFFTPEMERELQGRIALEQELRQALERGEFLLHYQPQIEIASGRIVGVEALVRWRHPERGMVPPAEFIPVAESSGLIRPLGEWVLKAACQQARAWRDQGTPLRVAVNLSGVQFQGSELVGSVERALEDAGIGAALLELEITETIMLQEDVDEALARLSRLGAFISVDDFGTGYGSLTYLRRFPVSKIKVDQLFIKTMMTDHDDAEIVRAVVGLGRNLNMRVIAEGVETEEQFAFLKEIGCDEIQGYYFSRPLPPDRFGELLSKGGLAPWYNDHRRSSFAR